MGEKGQAIGGAATNAAQSGASAADLGKIAAQLGASSNPAAGVGASAADDVTKNAAQLGAWSGQAPQAGPGAGAPGGEKGQLTGGTLGDSEGLQGSLAQQTKTQQTLSNLLKKQSDTADEIATNIK